MTEMKDDGFLRAELDELLDQDSVSLREKERTAFDRLIEPFRDIVLFGAGNFGRQALECLRQDGHEPLAFVDNNASLWGTQIEGLPVLSPPDAAKKFRGRAAFLVTVRSHENTHRFVDTKRRLMALGCRHVISFMPFLWKYAETLLPYYYVDRPHKIIEQAESLKEAFDLWYDQESQRTFLTQLYWRIVPDYDGLPLRTLRRQYFPRDILALNDNESFVDCGAFDGQTIKDFLDLSRGSFRGIVAFEADPENFACLASFVSRLPMGVRRRITLVEKAVSSADQRLRFLRTGTTSSRHCQGGDIEVEAVALDGLVMDHWPSYIKLDIEGDEIDALIGARRLIRDHRPVLAACAYHRQDDLWRIPLLIRSFNSGYRFFLKAHNEEGWELVCYAVPADRALQ